ncbi:MAG TPA: inositol monophosphatase family protein [Oscillatoriaceae cyanobacterium]
MSELLDFARRIAREAGQILHEGLSKPHEIRYKGAIDLVTEMDVASEKHVISAIRARYPDHAILAEESGASETANATHRWVIDPLDGTTNYAHGLPLFCVSIGLEVNGSMHLGVIYAPALDECYEAEVGHGAYCNGERIQVSETAELGKALLVTGFPYDVRVKSDNVVAFANFIHTAQAVRRLGSAALDLAWVASGRFDGFWEPRLKPWDLAAGSVIVAEAGGRVTGYHGKPFSIYGDEVLASNGHLHDPMIEVLARKTMLEGPTHG